MFCCDSFTDTPEQVEGANDKTNVVTPVHVKSQSFAFAHEESLVLKQGLLASQDGNTLVLKMIARNQLFPPVKFIKPKEDLVHSENAKSICHFVVSQTDQLKNCESKIKANCWSECHTVILKAHTQKQNNMIKGLQTQFISV